MAKNEELEKAVESCFDDVIAHGIYVGNLARLIGIEMHLPDDMLYELVIAGVLHDIGKIKIKNYLYDDENQSAVRQMRYVKLHSTYGYEMLKDRGYSEFILQSIYYHHENCDGSGYPENLPGNSIPIGAKILRIADVFIALVSDRPYRPAFDKKTAIELMIDEIKNFDMEVFLAFQRVINRTDMDRDIKKMEE